jgi:hypothetical protein
MGQEILCVCTFLGSFLENWKQIFPVKKLRAHRPSFHIHVSVSNFYIPTIDPPILQQ